MGADGKSLRLRHVLGSQADIRLYVNDYEVSQDDTIYGWTVVKDPETASVTLTQNEIVSTAEGCLGTVTSTQKEFPARKLLFDRVRKATDDTYEVSYFCYPPVCPKCGGTGLHFDYEYTNLGKLIKVENESKLAQDMEKIILTIIGSSIFYPWYGTSLVDLIGGKASGVTTQSQITAEISQALTNLKKLQRKQELYQLVTDREYLESIQSIQVQQSATDPTVFRVNVSTRNQAGGTATFTQDLRIDRGLFTTDLQELRRITL